MRVQPPEWSDSSQSHAGRRRKRQGSCLMVRTGVALSLGKPYSPWDYCPARHAKQIALLRCLCGSSGIVAKLCIDSTLRSAPQIHTQAPAPMQLAVRCAPKGHHARQA